MLCNKMLYSILLFFERKVIILQLNSILFPIAMLLGGKSTSFTLQNQYFCNANSMLLQSEVTTTDNQGDRFSATHTFQLDLIFRAYEYFFHTR